MRSGKSKFGPQSPLERAKAGPKAPMAAPSLMKEGQKQIDYDNLIASLLEDLKQFGGEIKGGSVPASRTSAESKGRADLMNRVNDKAKQLNVLSLSEGSQAVAATSLFCLLIMNDKLNEIGLQNYVLNKRVKELEDAANSVRPIQPSSGEVVG